MTWADHMVDQVTQTQHVGRVSDKTVWRYDSMYLIRALFVAIKLRYANDLADVVSETHNAFLPPVLAQWARENSQSIRSHVPKRRLLDMSMFPMDVAMPYFAGTGC